MARGDLTTYVEVADLLEQLPRLLREARRARGLTLRATGLQLGVSNATVLRIEMGADFLLTHAVVVLRWLDQGVAR